MTEERKRPTPEENEKKRTERTQEEPEAKKQKADVEEARKEEEAEEEGAPDAKRTKIDPKAAVTAQPATATAKEKKKRRKNKSPEAKKRQNKNKRLKRREKLKEMKVAVAAIAAAVAAAAPKKEEEKPTVVATATAAAAGDTKDVKATEIKKKKKERKKRKKSAAITKKQAEERGLHLTPIPTQLESREMLRTSIEHNQLAKDLAVERLKAANLRDMVFWSLGKGKLPRAWKWTKVAPKVEHFIVIGVHALTAATFDLCKGETAFPEIAKFKTSWTFATPGDKTHFFPAEAVIFGTRSKAASPPFLAGKPSTATTPVEAAAASSSSSATTESPAAAKTDASAVSTKPAAPLVAEDLLLSDVDMAVIGFPRPSDQVWKTMPRPTDAPPLPPERRVLGLDCEMCETTAGLELAKVSLVDLNEAVVYEQLVKPQHEIKSYLTQFSGIAEKTLEGVTTTLEEVKRKILQIVTEDVILVGHSLEHDLRSLQISHGKVIDTCELFPHQRGGGAKNKLSFLFELFFERPLRPEGTPHDSTADATAAVKLVKLALEKGRNFVMNKLGIPDPGSDPETLAKDLMTAEVPSLIIDTSKWLRRYIGGNAPRVVTTLPAETDEQALGLAHVIAEQKPEFAWIGFNSMLAGSAFMDAAKHANGVNLPDPEKVVAATAMLNEGLAMVDRGAGAVLAAAPPNSVVALIGLQGTTKTLWNMRATSKHNNDGTWKPEFEKILEQETKSARTCVLRIAFKS